MKIIESALAAGNGLVSCSGSDCTVCSIMETISTAFNYLMGISSALVILVLIVSGFVYLLSTGRNKYLIKAKVFAKSATTGFLFIIISWLVVRTLFFVTGYQNNASWWKFECDTQKGESRLSEDYYTQSLSALRAFPSLPNFVLSEEKEGQIKGFSSETNNFFLAQLNNLNPGERITFYLPVKDNINDIGTKVPFSAVSKRSSGELALDTKTVSFIDKLSNEIENGGMTLFDDKGSLLSQQASADFINFLIKVVISNLEKKIDLGGISNSIDTNPFGSGDKEDVYKDTSSENSSKANDLEKTLSDLESGKTKLSNESISQVIDQIVNDTFWNTGSVIVERSGSSSTSQSGSSGSSSGGSSSGSGADRSEGSGESDKGENEEGGKAMELDPADWENGTGSTEDIYRALKRIYARDYLRYEMMFRFTKFIGVGEAGENSAGVANSNQSDIPCIPTNGMKIVDIAHVLVHEGTHGAQSCLRITNEYPGVGSKTPDNGKIEAMACANEIGSLSREKSMEEFPKQMPIVTYNSGPVRGHFARYYTEASPRGDVNREKLDEEFQKCRDYPIKGIEGDPNTGGLPEDYYQTEGKFPYGWGDNNSLKLAPKEEENLKKIMTQKGAVNCEWGSCPPDGLPKLRKDTPCNCAPMRIEINDACGKSSKSAGKSGSGGE